MNILILDIGNSKTKCYLFDVEPRKYHDTCLLLYEDSVPTPRGHPYDLSYTAQSLIKKAMKTATVDVGMVTAFGDAFIHYGEGIKGIQNPRFVFADEPAPDVAEYAYHIQGFPRDIQLTGIRALKAKHNAEWDHMYSPNGWVTTQLCGKPSDDPWNAWDITQASVSGAFNLKAQQWIDPINTHISSHKRVGHIAGVPLLAGGLDNAFVDSEDTDPYIIAGTWLVIGRVFDTYDPKEFSEKRRDTVRWVISGKGNYHAQIVRKVSDPITKTEQKRILDDLSLLGLESYLEDNSAKNENAWHGGRHLLNAYFETQRVKPRVKVFGGYGEALAEALQPMTHQFHFSPVGPNERTDLYQHQMSALFVYSHYKQMEAQS